MLPSVNPNGWKRLSTKHKQDDDIVQINWNYEGQVQNHKNPLIMTMKKDRIRSDVRRIAMRKIYSLKDPLMLGIIWR